MDRRNFLEHTGYLLIGFHLFPFSLSSCSPSDNSSADPESFFKYEADPDAINAWIRLDTNGKVSLFTGKMELGQGIKTALQQIAAEELDVAIQRIQIITADTGRTPNENYTAGSNSIESSGMSIRQAAAEARYHLLTMAAAQLQKDPVQLSVQDGQVVDTTDPTSNISYWQLLRGKNLEEKISGQIKPKDPANYQIVGKAEKRADIVDIVSAQEHFIHDLRLEDMLHARVVRPPVYGARLLSAPEEKVRGQAGVVAVFRSGNFLAVLAEEEYAAIRAWRTLKAESRWEQEYITPSSEELFNSIDQLVYETKTVDQKGTVPSSFDQEALYKRPYHMHGSIGPSCALAEWDQELLTVWTHSQGVYPLRKTLADLLEISESQIRAIGVPGSGCYGHNGADDVAADVAFLAYHHPGRPIRLQWMREDEHQWEPYGSAMLLRIQATIAPDGKIQAWQGDVYSDTHSNRPGGDASRVLVAQHAALHRKMERGGVSGGAYRNASPYYNIPHIKIMAHAYEGPLRVSALRSLGAYANIFALESFMDELAYSSHQDPLQFRLKHLDDPRAQEVLTQVAHRSRWDIPFSDPNIARGIAFARYKNQASYFAVIATVRIHPNQKRYDLVKLTGVIDAGQAINPDGIKNQTEGGMIQSASWTLYEQVHYRSEGIWSNSWATYPIMRFPDLPEIDVMVIDRPHEAPLGAGEAAQGPTAAAIANALFAATGTRIRDLPLSPEKITW